MSKFQCSIVLNAAPAFAPKKRRGTQPGALPHLQYRFSLLLHNSLNPGAVFSFATQEVDAGSEAS